MSQQIFKTAPSKNRGDADKVFSIYKYWPLIIPLIIFIYATSIYLQARTRVPLYRQDCSSALLSSASVISGQPCIYKTANAGLRNTYTGRGIRDGQDIELSFPDGSETSLVIATVDNSMNYGHLTEAQVNGTYTVEIWHGKVTTIINAKHRINSVDNPEQKGSNSIGFILLLLPLSLIPVWACIRFLPIQKAKSR